ncbi:AlpA family phage regulatory protein [Streptomyces vinaceus]|nr:AlpA family phage regulatory protein [Streptomyces vinaceus]
MAGTKMLKLPEVLEEIEMSRAAFYRMRAVEDADRFPRPGGR